MNEWFILKISALHWYLLSPETRSYISWTTSLACCLVGVQCLIYNYLNTSLLFFVKCLFFLLFGGGLWIIVNRCRFVDFSIKSLLWKKLTFLRYSWGAKYIQCNMLNEMNIIQNITYNLIYLGRWLKLHGTHDCPTHYPYYITKIHFDHYLII